MPEAAVFDATYFINLFYSPSRETVGLLRGEYDRADSRLVSVVTLHEVYRLTLQKEGRDTARLRHSLILKEFTPVDVDEGIAVAAAELRHGHGFSLADGAVAATALREGCPVVSDDPHFRLVRGLKTRWIG